MKEFVETFQKDIHGTISGFDRMIFKGIIHGFFMGNGFYKFLAKEGVKLMDFKEYSIKTSTSIKEHLEGYIRSSECYHEYLNSPNISKEGTAKKIMAEKNITEGLICALSVVEPCRIMTIRLDRGTNKLVQSKEFRKCLHYYFYYMDKTFGFMHVKIQIWFPFNIQIYINGKSYLMQQLKNEGIRFTSYNNSITYVEDMTRAQQISDKLHEKKWDAVFDTFARRVNNLLPRIEEVFGGHSYKWMTEECEYATDVLFKSREALEKYLLYFFEYASLCQMGHNIYTFFGRKLHGHCEGEAVSDRKYFWDQGFRVKFSLDKNSIKIYDKDSVLRIETTINNANAFKIRNPNPQGKKKWVPMQKSISCLYRYAEVAKACNLRYLNSLNSVNRNNVLDRKIEQLCNRVETKLSVKSSSLPRKYAGFNLLSDFTCYVFNAVLNGTFKIRGFHNKDLRFLLIQLGTFSKQQIENMKKITGKITRLIAKLRAHKIVYKLPKTNRYRVTIKGEEIISRILMFKKLDLKFC
jgi:hypothetical protein